MITPEKVVIPQYDSGEILIINITTTEELRIPFEYQSNRINIFYFPETDLVCIQEKPCKFSQNRRNRRRIIHSYQHDVKLTYFSANSFEKP